MATSGVSEFLPSVIIKPKWFHIGPSKTGWGPREPYVIGFDSEAYNGSPICLQFSLPDERPEDATIIWTKPNTALIDFLSFLEPIAHEHARRQQIVVFGWNLHYEYTQLFRVLSSNTWEQSRFEVHGHPDPADCAGTVKCMTWEWKIDALNDKRYTFTISFRPHRDNRRNRTRDRYTVKFIDGMAFFNTSLDKAAAIVGIEGKDEFDLKGKLPQSRARHNAAFMAYSRKDAWITRVIGEKIVGYHQHYDVRMTISAPMYAAYVFKRQFLDGEIPLCEPRLEEAGLKSYHGGKNGYYLSRPAHFMDAYDYDVNAAYTSAMAQLPDPVESVWEDVHHYEPNVHALWYIVARVESCKWRAFQENNGRWYTFKDDGDLGFWITSYELDEALRQGEILDIYECSGWVMRGKSGTGSIRRYCDVMYDLKQNAATPEERQMAKLCLNSLYGKLIQKVPTGYDSVIPFWEFIEQPDGATKLTDMNMTEGGYKAGGLYHPALASLVTGYVRARIHDYEHRYRSIMTSTDGFLSMDAPQDGDLSAAMGKLKMKHGTLQIYRERLYYFAPFDGPATYALHGFRGTIVDLLLTPVEKGVYKYKATKMIGLRDSLRMQNGKRYQPGQFASIDMELNLTTVNERSPLRV